MSPKHKRKSPEGQWEQALIDAYYNERYHRVLDPLYEKFQQWKAGELQHADIDEAIHTVHKQNQELYTLFTQRRDWLVTLIQMDQEWFAFWVTDHPPSPGMELKKPITYVEVEEESENEEL